MPAQTVIQIRRDTGANWTTANPVLSSGEIGFETDTNQLKVGNGTLTWTALPYASGAGGASVEISETAPTDPEVGDVWFNSTDGRAYIYYDSTWVDLNPGIAGPAGKFTVSETEPADPAVGDGWFNSGTARLFIYYDNFWVEATSNYIGPTGEPGIVVQTSAPTDTDVLWLDSDDPADAVAVPAGGSTGQVLAKATGDDYDTEWTTLPTPPSGNAIINGAFEINQRNFSSTTASDAFGFDRWQMFSDGDGSTTYSSQAFTAGTGPSGYEPANFARLVSASQTSSAAASRLQQAIEDVRTFAGQTITVSFYAKAATGTPKIALELSQAFGSGGSTQVNTYGGQATISTTWARYSLTVAVPSVSGKTIGAGSLLRVNLYTSASSNYSSRTGSLGIQNNTFDIWGVQVEAGSTASAFRRNANSLQGELAACQRYYQRFSGNGTYAFDNVGPTGVAPLTSAVNYPIVLPVTLRANPTSVEFSGLGITLPGTATYALTGLTMPDSNRSVVLIQATTATTLVQFRPYFLTQNNNVNGFLAISAEL